MKRRLATLVLAVSAASGAAHAMTDAELQAIAGQRVHGDRTGACFALAVIDRDRVSRAFACADPAGAARIDANTAFEIGSVSKTMTATLLAGLIGEGKAALDDPLADYLPPGTKVPAFEGRPILLRHVVTHTSGLPALPPGIAPADPLDPYAAVDARMLLDALSRAELARAPGTQFEYSNFASMLLSYAVARRAGRDFETLLDERVFAPLGMEGAYINRRPQNVRAAVGHTPNAQPTPAWTFQTDLAGVGGVRATLDDMVRYVQAQLGVHGALDVSLKAAIERTQQPVETGAQPPMGMNWMIAPLNGRSVHAHEGGTGGFSSFVAFDRPRGRGVIVLSDTALHSIGGLGSIGLHLLDASVPLGKPRKAMPAPTELIDALVGEYQLDGAMRIELRREGDALVAQAAGQPELEMGYDDAGDFYPLALDARLQPQRKSDGTYAFVWHQGGAAIPARRVDANAAAQPAPALSADELQAYAGDYPLMPSFVLGVRAQGGTLLAQATGQGAFELSPAAADVFEAPAYGIEIRFERDASGEVVALELLQGGQTLRGRRTR